MYKQYSIAEARHNLASIVHDVEQASPVALTRRGKPIAMLISIREYQRLVTGKKSFWSTYLSFQEQFDLPALHIDPGIYERLRDQSPGRDFRF